MSPHIHADPRPAEAEALAAISPHITGIKRRILEQAGDAGERGVIPDEVEGLINTVRRRFTDLWKDGHIRPTEMTRKNKRGNSETVWILGRDKAAFTPGKTKTYVYLDRFVTGDGPFTGSVARPGLYVAHRNPLGAVSVMLPDGKLLGVKPGEFIECGTILR